MTGFNLLLLWREFGRPFKVTPLVGGRQLLGDAKQRRNSEQRERERENRKEEKREKKEREEGKGRKKKSKYIFISNLFSHLSV